MQDFSNAVTSNLPTFALQQTALEMRFSKLDTVDDSDWVLPHFAGSPASYLKEKVVEASHY